MLFGVGDVGIEVEWRGFKMLMDTRSKSMIEGRFLRVLPRKILRSVPLPKQRVRVGISYTLRVQRGSPIATVGP